VRRLIIVLAAAALVQAGCGGGGSSEPAAKPLTKAEYQAKLEQIAKDVGAQLKTSGSKTPTKKDLEAAKKALSRFAGELGKVSPPAEVAQAHEHLIAGMRRLGDDLEAIFRKVREAKTPAEGISALFGAPAIQLLLKTQQEFKAKGYDLNLTG
jgi:hypothetical protein